MKKSAMVILGALMLTACGPEHVKDEVRSVTVGTATVDENMEELHVSIIDDDTGQQWDVNLGSECAQYPLPTGEKFMARFDVSAYKEKPNEFYYAPYTDKVWEYLCK